MSIVENENEISGAEARDLVQRAAVLLRLRPVPGADRAQTSRWLDEVLAFLQSAAMARQLHSVGLTPPTDFETLLDQGPLLDHLAGSLDSHEDFAPVMLIPVAVEAAYIGLVGYAIYTYVTQPDG
jgi:hypothetical protein